MLIVCLREHRLKLVTQEDIHLQTHTSHIRSNYLSRPGDKISYINYLNILILCRHQSEIFNLSLLYGRKSAYSIH